MTTTLTAVTTTIDQLNTAVTAGEIRSFTRDSKERDHVPAPTILSIRRRNRS